MPDWNNRRSATELSTMPISSAITIAKIGATSATNSAVATTASATRDDSITPGRMLRSHVIGRMIRAKDARRVDRLGDEPAHRRRKVVSWGRENRAEIIADRPA